MNNTYTIISYQELGNDQDKHVFHAKNKRQVVGLMKTIMDNLNPKHVDILKDDQEIHDHKKEKKDE